MTTLGVLKEYYDKRAAEYDDWYLGRGLFAERDRPEWDAEVAQLTAVVASLPPARTLDVACGTGFLTQHLRGDVVALDQSERMLERTAAQAPKATVVQGDALSLPFPDATLRPRLHRALLRAPRERGAPPLPGRGRACRERAGRRRLVARSRRGRRGRAGARAQRRLALGGLQALVHRRRARRRARRRRRAARRPLVRRRARVRRDALPRRSPSLQRDQARVPRVRRRRPSARVAAGARPAARPARVPLRAGARASSRARNGGRGADARAGRFAAGSSSTRTSSTRPSTARR